MPAIPPSFGTNGGLGDKPRLAILTLHPITSVAKSAKWLYHSPGSGPSSGNGISSSIQPRPRLTRALTQFLSRNRNFRLRGGDDKTRKAGIGGRQGRICLSGVSSAPTNTGPIRGLRRTIRTRPRSWGTRCGRNRMIPFSGTDGMSSDRSSSNRRRDSGPPFVFCSLVSSFMLPAPLAFPSE